MGETAPHPQPSPSLDAGGLPGPLPLVLFIQGWGVLELSAVLRAKTPAHPDLPFPGLGDPRPFECPAGSASPRIRSPAHRTGLLPSAPQESDYPASPLHTDPYTNNPVYTIARAWTASGQNPRSPPASTRSPTEAIGTPENRAASTRVTPRGGLPQRPALSPRRSRRVCSGHPRRSPAASTRTPGAARARTGADPQPPAYLQRRAGTWLRSRRRAGGGQAGSVGSGSAAAGSVHLAAAARALLTPGPGRRQPSWFSTGGRTAPDVAPARGGRGRNA